MTATHRASRGHLVESVPELHTEWFDANEFSAAVYIPETGDRHHLDGAASAVWALCEEPISEADLITEIASLGATKHQAREVVEGALSLFAEAGLITGDTRDEPELSTSSGHSHTETQHLPRDPDP